MESTSKPNRKLSRRELLRLAALGGAGLVAAACGGTPAPTPTPLKVEVTKIVEKIVTPTPKPAPKQIAYIRFLTQETDPNEVAVYRKQIADFESKNPDIRIELQLTGPDQIVEKMVAAFTAGVTALDMIQPNPPIAFLLAAKGMLLPIDDVVQELGGDSFFYDNSVMKLKGKRYGVPFGGGTCLIWYRKDYFEADGIKVPKTLEELEAAARHFTKKFNPKSPTEFGFNLPFSRSMTTQAFIMPFHWTFGGERFDKDLNVVFDSDATAEFLDWYAKMFQYTSEASTGYSWGEMISPFLAGQAAMTLYLGRVLGRIYTGAPQLLGKVGVFMYPKKKLLITEDDPNYYVINVKTPYPEQCKRWLKYTLTGQPSFDFLCSIPTHLPPATKEQEKWWNQAKTGCKELDENPDIKKAFGDAVAYAYNPMLNAGGVTEAIKQGKDTYVPTGVPNPILPATEGDLWTMPTAIQNVVIKKMSPRDAIKAVMPDTLKAVENAKKETGWS